MPTCTDVDVRLPYSPSQLHAAKPDSQSSIVRTWSIFVSIRGGLDSSMESVVYMLHASFTAKYLEGHVVMKTFLPWTESRSETTMAGRGQSALSNQR